MNPATGGSAASAMATSPRVACTSIQLPAASQAPSCSRKIPAQRPCSSTARAASPARLLNRVERVRVGREPASDLVMCPACVRLVHLARPDERFCAVLTVLLAVLTVLLPSRDRSDARCSLPRD